MWRWKHFHPKWTRPDRLCQRGNVVNMSSHFKTIIRIVQVGNHLLGTHVQANFMSVYIPGYFILKIRIFPTKYIYFVNSSATVYKGRHMETVNVQTRSFFYSKVLFRGIFSGWDLAKWLERLTANAKVATVLGSIPASFDIVESEGRQIKQSWIYCRT